MATKKVENVEIEENMEDTFTFTDVIKKPEYTGPMVQVFLPEIDGGVNGVKVDQYEHVTIANEEGEKIWHVRRGIPVDVPVPVFIVLKQKYPNC